MFRFFVMSLIAACVLLASTAPAAQKPNELEIKQSDSKNERFEKNGLVLKVYAPGSVKVGESAELVLKLKIPRGFHIYGSQDQTHPTKVVLEPNPSIQLGEIDIPRGTRHAKPGGGVNYWLERNKTITQSITIASDAEGPINLVGHLDFLICDERSCKPPAKLKFNVTLDVPVAETKAKTEVAKVEFEAPVRITAAGKSVETEAPGYATPCVADIDGDGIKDLLVGQYADGKIKVYKGLGHGKFGEGSWLTAAGEIASVPGVW